MLVEQKKVEAFHRGRRRLQRVHDSDCGLFYVRGAAMARPKNPEDVATGPARCARAAARLTIVDILAEYGTTARVHRRAADKSTRDERSEAVGLL